MISPNDVTRFCLGIDASTITLATLVTSGDRGYSG
jgi:hypothetical protein